MRNGNSAKVRKFVLFVLISTGFYFYFDGDYSKNVENNFYNVSGNFLVETEFCKIPNMNPFAEEAMSVFKRENYPTCSQKRPLTSITYDYEKNKAFLVIHEEFAGDFLYFWQSRLKCCFKRILRADGENADLYVTYSSCQLFSSMHKLQVDDEFIIVRCSGVLNLFFWQPSILLYRNAHAIINRKESVARGKSSKEKMSVLMMGIDSVSRLNFIRSLPESYRHLQKNDWFELRGYNKIADNTFPNLMAILAGQNYSEIAKSRDWTKPGDVINCPFVWKDFKKLGYATAYAEDESYMSTFNYLETGFVQKPTDYYFRPFSIAAERNLRLRMSHKSMICLGYQPYADHVYNFGFDIAQRYVNDSYFGLFWTNSFSHEDFSLVSSMDLRVKFYLEQLETRGILNSSIVIFFSDHGMRFGPIRNVFIGWLEERLPFFYIWLPQTFRESHPEIVQALRTNRDRLASPYDVHVTLKHILKLSGEFNEEPEAISCPKCQSLFTELPLNRSCSDAGIDRHWCTCVDFQVIDETSKVVESAAKQILNKINKDLQQHSKCAQLTLKKIHSARKSQHKTSTDYLVSFTVSPSDALFEATIQCEDENCREHKIVGTVSRLNRYDNQGDCVSNPHLRKYCYCL